MDTLEDKLQNIGFSDVFVESIKNAEHFDSLDINVANFDFQPIENKIVSSTELKAVDIPTSINICVLGKECNEQE